MGSGSVFRLRTPLSETHLGIKKERGKEGGKKRKERSGVIVKRIWGGVLKLLWGSSCLDRAHGERSYLFYGWGFE